MKINNELQVEQPKFFDSILGKGFFLLWIALLFPCLVSSQNEEVEENYLEYFKLPRETLFLHTNKTTYLTKEDIWFKVYAFDRKNQLPSQATSNIYFGLYDSSGNELSKKLYRSKEGAAIGNFTLDSTLPSGEYFLKVATNWMKNFKEDDAFVQKIQIINPTSENKTKDPISTKEYDFQFLPEGGYALFDVKNSIGIKVVDDTGRGIRATGVLVNSKDEEVAQFKTNVLGIGKFTFTPKKDERYTAKVTLENGKEFEQAFSEFQNIGVAIRINNLIKEKAIIILSLNEDSYNQIGDQKFKLILHKDGKIKSIPVIFDQLKKQVVIARNDLYPGMNTVTLFNEEDTPIIERIFFNAKGAITTSELIVNETRKTNDSISFQLMSNVPASGKILKASISVLPGETKSYDPDHSIISAIHLKPYVKGSIENPQYYFKNFDRKKQYELDVLLITQGWSRYSWDRIFNLPPKPSFDFENGLTINGFVNNKPKNAPVIILYPTAMNNSLFIPLDENGRFTIKNFYPQANEEISFSFVGEKGNIKKPNMSLSYIQHVGKDIVNTANFQSYTSYYQDKNDIPNTFILNDTYEQLEEIQIKTDLKKKLREETRDPILVNGKVTKIGKEEVYQYPNILDYIRNRGFLVEENLGYVRITARTRGNLEYTPTVFLDNIIINGSLNVLFNFPTEQVERIVIDPTGVGLGLSGGFGGAIKIFTRKRMFKFNDDATNIKNNLFVSTSEIGFQPIKEFYMPKYASYQIQSFKNYGIIHWDSNVVISYGVSNELNMINTRLDEINFYVEGISSDGSVFSQVIKVDTATQK